MDDEVNRQHMRSHMTGVLAKIHGFNTDAHIHTHIHTYIRAYAQTLTTDTYAKTHKQILAHAHKCALRWKYTLLHTRKNIITHTRTRRHTQFYSHANTHSRTQTHIIRRT